MPIGSMLKIYRASYLDHKTIYSSNGHIQSLHSRIRNKEAALTPKTMRIPYRLPAWGALAMFSLISLLSVVLDRETAWNFPEKWATALTSISFVVAVIVSCLHAVEEIRNKFVSSKIEGGVIVLLVVIWAMAVPVIMAQNNSLAVRGKEIMDANLYFSSWAAFICILYMFSSYGASSMPYHAKWWLCLVISSGVVLAAASHSLRTQKSCNATGYAKERCSRLRLALSLSLVSTVIAAGVVATSTFLRQGIPKHANLAAAVIVLCVWGVLVAFLTFSEGPGSMVGNLFFGTWVSFCLALYLATLHSISPTSSTASGATSTVTTSTVKKTHGATTVAQGSA